MNPPASLTSGSRKGSPVSMAACVAMSSITSMVISPSSGMSLPPLWADAACTAAMKAG